MLLLLLLTACVHTGFQGPVPEAPALWDQLRAAHRLPDSVSCEAKAFVDAPENGGRYGLNLAVQKPSSLRIEALTPLGDPAAVLVAHEGRFALYDLRDHVFYRGPSTPANLSRLLPAPLRDDELVALVTGGVPELPGAEPVLARREGDEALLVLSTVPPGTQGLRGFTQEILVGSDLRVKEVRRFSAGGSGARELLWSVRLDEHEGSSGVQLPHLIHLTVPDRHTEVDLRLREETVGRPPPARAFAIAPPPGVELRELP